ncbi:MAG: NAD(P)/FAD-dependent oxidoreductase [Pseudomonadota bacterium]|nr:NAD(P)/FAD-dependent oxidoreductase [Pseudomonadota bacterium]
MGVPRVVVIGGGFGGLEVCRRLARANKRGEIELTLIDKENFFQFNPLLPEVATGAVETRHIVYPLREFCIPRKIRFVRNKVRTVDADARVLTLHNDLSIPYDKLVIAAGSTTNFFGIPGAEQHSFVFKTLMDAIRLRAHVIEMWELADQATAANVRRGLLTFAVVGGGITGVEVCSQLMTMFRTTMKRLYPNVPQNLVTVYLIEAADSILPGLRLEHTQVALGHLRNLGVNLVLNRKVVEVTEATVRLDDGAVIPAHTLVWTTGVRGAQLEHPWPWPTGRGGRLAVDRTCKVTDGVWAIGDIAEAYEADGKLVPQVAQGAIQEGRLAAENLLAEMAGKPTRELKYIDLGYFVGLGQHSTVASLMGIPVSGSLAFYLWALIYLFKVVGFAKQLEVALDFVKGLFVGHDTSLVHERRRILRPQDLEPDLSGAQKLLTIVTAPEPETPVEPEGVPEVVPSKVDAK